MSNLQGGYWVGQEQYDPNTLLDFARHAEIVGFDIICSSDHFHPWRDSNAHSGFPWVWLSVLASQTTNTEVGTAVTTPLLRYHPAIVAQAFATLDYMFPGRVFITIGTGHKMNETPLGFEWPGFKEKIKRLEEAITIIKQLWSGEFVNFKGEFYTLNDAKLYTIPKKKIPIHVATANTRVAKLAGEFCDGVLTNPRGLENHVKILDAARNAASDSGKDPSTISTCMEFKVSYDVDYDKALSSAVYWAPTAIPREVREHISDPRDFESNVGEKEVEKIEKSWLITTNSEAIIKKLESLMKSGYNRVYIHSASPHEKKFLDLLGRDVLPWMREYYDTLVNPITLVSD